MQLCNKNDTTFQLKKYEHKGLVVSVKRQNIYVYMKKKKKKKKNRQL